MMNNTESVVCAICETSQYEERLFPVRSGHLVKCRRCDLYYTNPRRSDYIHNVLNNNTPDVLFEGKKLNYEGRMMEFHKYLEIIEKHKRPPGRILDVGCYEGFFLEEASKRGWKCYGVEPDVGGAKHARERLKLDVRQSILEKAAYDDEYFDVITLFSTLEHLPDPGGVLKEVRRIIKDDGLLVISVPTVPFYLNLMKSRCRMFIGDHYYFFNNGAMSRLLSKTGYSLVSGRYYSKSVDLETVAGRLSSDWQPCSLGNIGKLLRICVEKMGMGGIRFTVNLFDMKVYMARPVRPEKAPEAFYEGCSG